jgi:hypothetical protein
MVIVFLYACKKAAGVGGKNEINGSVMYYNPVTASNNPAPKATIYVTYGSNTSTSQYNQAILTDDNGKFIIEGLEKGDYYLRAEFKDENGFSYSSPGYGIILKNKKNKVELNFTVE